MRGDLTVLKTASITGLTVADRFVVEGNRIAARHQAGIRLVPGGEVCPVELAIMVGPTGEGDRLLRVLFGERWFDIEETGWKAA